MNSFQRIFYFLKFKFVHFVIKLFAVSVISWFLFNNIQFCKRSAQIVDIKSFLIDFNVSKDLSFGAVNINQSTKFFVGNIFQNILENDFVQLFINERCKQFFVSTKSNTICWHEAIA